jgi:hypothetical protein
MEPTCRKCKSAILDTYYFCPNCGKKIKDPPVSTTILKQLYIYLFSLFLPPFGLIYVYPYLMTKGRKAKIIGLVALILTLVSSYFTLVYIMNTYNNINKQFQDLQFLGY